LEGNLKENVIYFITIADTGYSRSWNYYAGLKKNGTRVEFFKLDNTKLIKEFISLRKQTNRSDIFIVMSPSHYLTPLIRIFLGKNTYLDAGWSLFEGSILARRQIGFMGINLIKTYSIDLIASIFAKRIFLESDAQVNFYCKLFLVRKSKCSVIYTGVDEEQFEVNDDFPTPADIYGNGAIVMFRGKYTVEAGLEVLAQASKLLDDEKITLWIFSPGIPKNLEFGKNTLVFGNFIDSKNNLAKIYTEAGLTLGQLSDYPRLNRTIPHKAFESALLAKPYLCSRSKGILEVFSEKKEIICFNPGDPIDLANKIRIFFELRRDFENIGICMHEKYMANLSQLKLSLTLLRLVEKTS
jgi:glycosyltransferase involved in cell wall biosynthesis